MISLLERDAKTGLSDGRPKKLTLQAEQTIRDAFDKFKGDGVAVTHQWLADIFNVSVDTIKRALRADRR